MSSLIDRTIDSVRDLSSRLRPSVLDDLGLREAIEWQANEFGQRYGADCVLDLGDGDDIVDAQVSLSVFRIFQEALTNIARHANAAMVRITLHQDAGGLKLLVEDDGIGIEAVTAASGDSLGLLGMRERAASIGGFVSVRPADAGGTNVEVRVPL